MAQDWHSQIDIYGPLEQATRCLDNWLREEGRQLDPVARQKAAALMARYFHYEDEVTDQLMLSFLRHYSGKKELDMEDPTAVRLELKSVLDSAAAGGRPRIETRLMTGLLALCIVFSLCVAGWVAAEAKITPAQQASLKTLVAAVASHEQAAGTTSGAVWSDIKSPLHVRRYQDISWWDYQTIKAQLEERLKK